MRIRMPLLALTLLLAASSLFAALDREIVIGAFSTPKQAHYRNLSLEAYLERDREAERILNAKRFIFDVKYTGKHYRAVLTRFLDRKEMLTVFSKTKEIYPDAFITKSTAARIPPMPSKAKPAAKTAAPPKPLHRPKPKPTLAPAPAAGKTAAPKPAAAPAKTQKTSGEAQTPSEPDIVIIDETTDEPAPPAAKTAPAKETVVPDREKAVEAAPPAAPEPASGGSSSFLLYGAIAVAALLVLLLLLLARRKKAEPSVLKTPELIDLEPKPAEEPPAPETPEPAAETTPVREVPAAPAEAPHVPEPEEPAPETSEPPKEPEPAAPAAEIREETPEEPAEDSRQSPRKKRELKPHGRAITKEDLRDFAGNRILVAEDNLINQKVISKLLEDSGIEIVMANNGQEALDILASDPNFNMILMDANMPVMDGFEATREIRQNILYEPIVVVALSGDVSSDDIRKMREAGMEEQLAKPLRVEALYDVMYQYLDLAGEKAEEEKAADTKAHEAEPLDIETGIDICGGDKSMYVEILDEFLQAYGESDLLVDAYLKAHDDGKLVALMLDIRGVAGNIGATPFSDAAEELREAVLTNETERYEALRETFNEELARLREAIERYKSRGR